MTERDYQLGIQAIRAYRVGAVVAAAAALDEMSYEGLSAFVAAMKGTTDERAHS